MTVVGANPHFDLRFLEERRRVPSLGHHHRVLDIESYALPYLQSQPPLKGLAAIAEELRGNGFIIPKPDHTAAGDVETLREVHRALRDWYSENIPD